MHQRTVLPNGLCVLATPIPGAPSVTVAAFVRAGSLYEDDKLAGVSHYLEHLLYKGTKHYPDARQISELIEGVGGMMNASTDRELTVYWFKVARPHYQRAASLIADMLLSPLLDPKEIEKERQVILEEIAMTNDYPSFRAELLIEDALWPDQPMGRDVAGTKQSVNALTRDDIVKYTARQYGPTNVVISVAGDLSLEQAVESLGPEIGQWKPTRSLEPLPVSDTANGSRFRMESRKTDQAHLCLALHSLPLDHKDRYAEDLMNTILGEGMSSRLFVELREKRGLVYDIHSSVSHYRNTGCMVVNCGVDPKNSYKAVRLIIDELEKLRERVPEAELTKAKEMSKGRLLLRLEDTRSVAMWSGAQEALLRRVRTPEEVLARVAEVTADDVQRVARDLITPEKLHMSVVGAFRSEARFRRLIGE